MAVPLAATEIVAATSSYVDHRYSALEDGSENLTSRSRYRTPHLRRTSVLVDVW